MSPEQHADEQVDALLAGAATPALVVMLTTYVAAVGALLTGILL